LESQRVKCLTEGYLRGWLSFEYPLSSSRTREALIIDYIEDERYYNLLKNRLMVETVLRSASGSDRKDIYDPIFEVQRLMIGLQLPSAAPVDKIKSDNGPLTKDEIAKWKAFFASVNK
jgi:hypothetical protein